MAFNRAIAIDQRYAIQDISPEAPEQELLDAVHFRGEQEMARVASEQLVFSLEQPSGSKV